MRLIKIYAQKIQVLRIMAGYFGGKLKYSRKLNNKPKFKILYLIIPK